jgi:phosphoribosylanthranilate isomerase
MIVKVCGMRDAANIEEVVRCKPDLMGFIFYPKSKRYVGEGFEASIITSIMPEIQSTGVFVNEDINKIIDLAEIYRFDFLQLHGNESPRYCLELKELGYKVLKAFGINDEFEWDSLLPYMEVCDYFLFDTSTSNYGGSGKKFDWTLLKKYTYDKPFLLSGGINPEDAPEIANIQHPKFAGIDINSGFEISPGLKDTKKIELFLNEIK